MRAEPQKELTQLRELVATLQAALEQSRQENALLRQKVDALVRRVFGTSSERIDPAQLQLLLQLPAAAPMVAAEPAKTPTEFSSPRARREHSPRLPDDLPLVEQVIDPEPVQAAPQAWRCIGQEVSEQLDYEPGRFLRRRLVRRKYVHRTDTDQAPIIAPLPQSLRERGLAAPGLLAHILVSKYCDHLPLYRQEQIFARRHDVHLPRQTLARWVELAADWLKPIYETIRTGVLGGGYVQIDETPIQYLAPGNGQTKQGYLWTAHRPRGDVLYRWETSRAAACLENLVPVDFTGTIQCDGYAGYGAFAHRRSSAITLAGCWAHVRRKFHDALEQTPRTGGWLPARSNTSTRWKRTCVNTAPARDYASRCGRTKADRSWNGSRKPSSSSRPATGTCPKVCSVKPSIMRWANGRRWRFTWAMVAWRSTTTWWKTPFVRRPLERRTGFSSATQERANAARLFIP